MEELREDHDDGTVARVAAVGIAKASGMVCLRVPHDTIGGRRIQQFWTVASTANAVLELGDKLVCQGVERVVMEATGSYWRLFFCLPGARGLDCWLVNARDVKNVAGLPKTGELDAVWLAKLAGRGMVRASFVPPEAVRQLRDFTRSRTVEDEAVRPTSGGRGRQPPGMGRVGAAGARSQYPGQGSTDTDAIVTSRQRCVLGMSADY